MEISEFCIFRFPNKLNHFAWKYIGLILNEIQKKIIKT